MSSASNSDGNDAILVGPGDIRDFNSDNILPLPAVDLAKIREWLQPTPYDQERSEYSRHRAAHLTGTGKWLTSTKTYQQWHSGENGLLWIKGIPGSGKSVMAASIIDQLRKEEVPVIYFFFRQIIDANHKPVAALRDWLCQILDYNPPLQVRLKSYIDNRRSIESLSPSDLWKDLKLSLESFPKAYCVTDALDEMDKGNDEFLHSLVELGQWRASNVKVLITSRPVASLETSLRTFPIPQIRLEERLVDVDIAAYVQYKLRGSSIPEEYWSIIEEAIPGRANGLFLYARLSMAAFLEPGADAHEVLKALPADLNVMYNELLWEHAKRSNVSDEIQLLVLQFVTHATRPLRLLEIAEVMNTVHVSSGDHSLKETKDLVKAACGPLLEILPDETVSVVHHSFTEFLKGLTRSTDSHDSAYPVLQSGPTNRCLAVVCLDYLRSGCLDNQKVNKRSEIDDIFNPKREEQSGLRLQFPFLEYAATNWYEHTRRAASAGADVSVVYDLLDTFFAEKHRYNVWLDIAWPESSIEGVTPLHVAALTGLAQYTAHLLQKRDTGIEARDRNHTTPLYWAATYGHAEVVQVLLHNGADPDAEQTQGLRPLHQAASNNCVEVVKILLAAGVNPLTPKTRETPGNWCGNAPRSYGHTPLMYACHNGHVKAVAEFLPFLKDIEICHRALSWAADNSHAAIVDLILHHPGVDVNAKWRGDTALFKACESGDFKTIDVLLKAGADPNIFCDDTEDEFAGFSCVRSGQGPRLGQEPRGFTALHGLCRRQIYSKSAASESVEALFNAGANIHMKTPDGSTALHYACKSSINLVKPLLEAGVDPTVENDVGETPLHTDGKTDDQLLPLLLERGTVDINRSRSTDGKTPLLCRLDGLYNKSVLTFLKYKPDVNATDTEGNAALHKVLKCGLIQSIDALLAAGAIPNLKNRHGNTPLHVMRYGDTAHVCKLLDAGADLEARNIAGETVLLTQFTSSTLDSEGRIRGFEMLINQGARTDTRDYKGRTLWHHGCEHQERLDHLKNLGLEPTVMDHEGNTPLHELAAAKSHYKLESMKYLMGLGLEVDQPNHRGRTILHILCSWADCYEYGSSSVKKDQALDYVLAVSNNVNPSDIEGIQPLHLAATICENFVFKLLNAGADLFAVTHEGMTILHLAARARQSGIVDMILSRLSSLETKVRMSFIDQKNREGKAALHYACLSGRPETVKSLLEAGADPNLLDNFYHVPFTMCVGFENEQELWRDGRRSWDDGLNAAGLLLADSTRPFYDTNRRKDRHDFSQLRTEHDTARLGEIMDLLFQYGAVSTGYHGCLQGAWGAATMLQFGYTIDCLLSLEARVPDAKIIDHWRHDEGFLVASYCRKATKEALKETARPEDGEEWSERHDSFAQRRILKRALTLRHFDLFEELAADSACLTVPEHGGNTILNDLVRWGYSGILAQVCTRDLATKFNDHDWCREAEAKQSLSESFIPPLIVSACTSRLPNMDVLKQLVEDFGVSMDAQLTEHTYRRSKYRILVTTGALHCLATGSCWWYVDKALPYLIQKGASLELRSHEGKTPLHVALESTTPFSNEAARILIQGGADINAVDDDGITCLAKAGNDLDLIKLLIAHGAEVSATAILSVIRFGQVEILGILLSQGDHANLRMPGLIQHRSDIVNSEILPLLYASSYQNWDLRASNWAATQARMMTVLLEQGADPFATFVKYTKRPGPHDDDFDLGDEPTEEPVPGLPTESCTIIHEILSCGHMLDPFFQIPSLDLERRDQSGCTLLLAASKNHKTLGTRIVPTQEQDTIAKTVFQELINRGADVMAQDNDGKNVLHLIGESNEFNSESHFAGTLRAVIINNTSLVHQADRSGDTPLHCALRHRAYEYADLLLDNGADPTETDSNGDTGLHHIASKPMTDLLLTRFLDAGLDVAEDEDEARHYIASKLMTDFLDAGVDINARNKQGDTPLFKYIENEFPSTCYDSRYEPPLSDGEEFSDPVFDFFHETGADFFARNNAGSSLLHLLAAIKVETGFRRKSAPVGIVESFKYLMHLGLDPMAEDARQRTSLDVAAAYESEHILKLFERKPME